MLDGLTISVLIFSAIRLTSLLGKIAVAGGVVFAQGQALGFEEPAADAGYPEAGTTVDVSAHVGKSVALQLEFYFVEF